MAGRRWTKEEIEKLENLSGTYTVASIAKILGRSYIAVNNKIHRLGISGFLGSTDLLTVNQVCQMLGIHYRTLQCKWERKGLKLLHKGNYVVIRQEELIRYMKEHPEDWNAYKIRDDTLFRKYNWYKEKKKTDRPKKYFWTSGEIQKMQYLRHCGFSISEIAKKLGRSESSIKYKLYRGGTICRY